jgi:hypothetical protein
VTSCNNRKFSPFRKECLRNKAIEISMLDVPSNRNLKISKLYETINFGSTRRANEDLLNMMNDHDSNYDPEEFKKSTDNIRNIKLLGKTIKATLRPHTRSVSNSKKVLTKVKKNRMIHLNKMM